MQTLGETFTCVIDAPGKAVLLTFAGAITEADLVKAHHTVRDSPDFDPAFDCLIDLSSVTTVNVTSQAVHELAGEVQLRCTGKCAIVACQDITFGLARVFELSAGPMTDRIEVFRDVRDAEVWLAR